jgi:hypothetical protein
MLLTSQCWAATIEPGQGDLTVNQGQGFQPINSRVDANVGDSVMVGPGGAAAVTYPDGCNVAVQPGAVVTIAPISPCAAGSYAQDNHDYNNNNYNQYWPYVLGIGAFVGIGFLFYEVTRDHHHNTSPASP